MRDQWEKNDEHPLNDKEKKKKKTEHPPHSCLELS